MKITSLAFVAALAIPSLAIADDMKKPAPADKTKAAAKLVDDDVKLVAHIHHVNMMEIDMGKLAQKMGGDAVKKYGAMLVKEHTDGDKDLIAFAKTKGVAKIPADVPPTEAAKKEMDDMMAKTAELKKMKGAEFDRQFLMMMQTAHDTELAKLTVAIPTIQDMDLQTKMKDLQPVLQRHADTARDLQKAAPTASTTPATPTSPATAKK
jgi:putative membrane protein